MTTLIADFATPIVTGDAAASIVYRLTDADGAVWRSSPYVLANALVWAESSPNASGQWLVIPTLRHLMAGTTAQIELYLGTVDRQLFRVIENNPYQDFITLSPNVLYLGADLLMPTIQEAVAEAGIGEVEYTTGGALANMPPPIAKALYLWRNRAFAAAGNTIYASQEFATGLGIQWNETLRSDWTDGTGNITAICHVDWNYLAAFKRNAVAIMSGPGPDGLGHGNYIVQTLSTKAGCSNPKSIVNGADGCYFQDAQTGRLMLLSPDLQVRECAPGAFDYSGRTITATLHVEALRQVWFCYENAIIVLDYKHRAEASPMGSVYRWVLPVSLGNIAGATIRAVAPELVMSTGNIVAFDIGRAYDEEADGTTYPVLQYWVTGDLQPAGLQRQVNVSRVQVLGEYVGDHAIRLTTYPNYSATGTATTINVTAAPEQFTTRPPGLMRAQSVRMKLEELAYSPGDILTSITTTGGYITALLAGSLTLTLTMSDGTAQTATKAASVWVAAAPSGGAGTYTMEIVHIHAVPPDLTIVSATLTVGTAFSGTGITNAVASVRRDGGTAGEIFSGKSLLAPATFASGTLSLTSSLGLTPSLTAGPKFVGFALEIQDCGKLSNPGVGRTF